MFLFVIKYFIVWIDYIYWLLDVWIFFFFFLPLLAITNNVSVNVGIVVFDVTCVFISQVDT